MRLLIFAFALSVLAQTPPGQTPFAGFEERVNDYMKLRKAAEADSGRLSPTPSAKDLDAKKSALSAKIRAARTSARQGELFTPDAAREFRRVIALDLQHHPRRVKESIRSGEVVEGKVHVNDSYPDHVPLETTPPTLLMSLPPLPMDLDYRFVGSTLALRDVGANLIIDYLPNALPLQ
jgi:hypothetical protein